MAIVIFVIFLNILIVLMCLGIVWWLWQLRRTLIRTTWVLTQVERNCHQTLHPAPEHISVGQQGTHHLRQQYQRLGKQLQQIENLLSLVSLGQTLWRRSRRFSSGRRFR